MKKDRSYKRMFSCRAMVTAFLKGFLKGDWDSSVIWKTLEEVKTRYIASIEVDRENDLMWKVQRKDGRELYIFLMFEFQSTVDRSMIVRMNVYTALFYYHHWKQHKDAKTGKPWKAPLLASVVLYTGRAPWTAATELAELTPPWPPELKELRDFGQRMKFMLVSANELEALEGEEPNVSDALFRMIRAQSKAQAKSAAQWMGQALRAAGSKELYQAVLEWFNTVYTKDRLPTTELKEVGSWKEVPDMLEQNYESWEDRWLAKGIAKGIAKGEVRGIAKGEVRGIAKGEVRGIAKGEVKGRKDLLLQLVRVRFGEASADRLAAMLESIQSLPTLDKIGLWVLECGSAETLFAKVRRVGLSGA